MHHKRALIIIAAVITLAGSRFLDTDTLRPVHAAHSLPHHTSETEKPKVENVARSGAIGPDEFAQDINPLTGISVADATQLDRRPIIVKISNAPPLVRPQAGLGAADLVFEHYAEGGLTRFSAVFYAQAPRRVGSIRSARLIDYELMPMYQGLLAFSGASSGVEERLNGSEFAQRLFKGVLFGRPYYWRDETLEAPHNMFTNLGALWELAAAQGLNQRPALRGMAFQTPAPSGSAGPANSIDLRYRATRVRWDYEPAGGQYLRSADGEGHYDADTLQQIAASNIVILYAEHTLTDIIESQWQGSISYSIEIKLWFEGDAILFRDGQRYDARWVRPTREDLIGLRTQSGELLHLKPGNTWFQVVPLPEQQNPQEEWLRVE